MAAGLRQRPMNRENWITQVSRLLTGDSHPTWSPRPLVWGRTQGQANPGFPPVAHHGPQSLTREPLEGFLGFPMSTTRHLPGMGPATWKRPPSGGLASSATSFISARTVLGSRPATPAASQRHRSSSSALLVDEHSPRLSPRMHHVGQGRDCSVRRLFPTFSPEGPWGAGYLTAVDSATSIASSPRSRGDQPLCGVV
jgi:hypothetical protein